MTTAFDLILIEAVKEICNIDTSATNNNLGIIRLADGDSLIVAEVNNISKEKRIKLGQKVTNEDSYINFIKYNVSYFGDDDKQRLDELEYIKSSIEDIDIF
jgi:hypothetical protein